MTPDLEENVFLPLNKEQVLEEMEKTHNVMRSKMGNMITNSSVFPYKLSIHAASMLYTGMVQYAETTASLFDEGLEDGHYSMLRADTVIEEAERLIALLMTVPSQIRVKLTVDLLMLVEKTKELREEFLQDEIKNINKYNEGKLTNTQTSS